MAPLLQSKGTEFTVNVSQDATSSPTAAIAQECTGSSEDVIEDSIKDTQGVRNTRAAQNHAENDEGAIVEDSMKDNTQAYRSGRVHSPLQPLQADEDELYSATPRRQVPQDKREASAMDMAIQQSPRRDMPADQHADRVTAYGNVTGGKQRQNDVSAKRNPSDGLFSKGTTVRRAGEGAKEDETEKLNATSDRSKHRSVDSERPLINAVAYQGDEVRADAGERAEIEDLQPKSTKKTQRTVPRTDGLKSNLAAYPNSTSKLPIKGSVSALEALRTRRAADGQGSEKSPSHGHAPLQSIASATADLANSAKHGKELPGKTQQTAMRQGRKPAERMEIETMQALSAKAMSEPVQKPAQESEVESDIEKRPTTGKLRSLRGAGQTQAPGLSSTATKHHVDAYDHVGHQYNETSNIVVNGQAANEQRMAAPTGNGLLKRPARSSRANRVQKDVSSDIADPSDTQGEQRPSKKARTPAKATAKNAPKPPPKSKTQVREAGVDKTKSTSDGTSGRVRGNSGKRNTQTRTTGTGRTNVRTRMMAQLEVVEGNSAPHHSGETAAVHNLAPTALVTDENSKDGETSKPHANETLEDFEKSVFNYEEIPSGQEVGETVCSNNPTLADTNISAATKKFKTTERTAVINFEPSQRGQSLSGPQGTSEENAIELSDRKSSSSLPPPLHEETAPPASSGQNLGRTVNEELPRTPAAFPSSPPEIRRAVPIDDRSRVRDSTIQRPTIISFDKSGPRNQGTMSAKNERYSVGTSRTLVGSAPRAVLSDVSAETRLENKHKDRPAAAVNSMKPLKAATAILHPNVAPDVADALARFTRKSRETASTKETRNEPHTSMSKHGTHPQESLPPLEDDGFVAIDNFDEATYVTQATVPVAVAHGKPEMGIGEVWEEDMPTAPKAPQEHNLHQALTVPSMVEHEHSTGGKMDVQRTTAPLKRGLDASTGEQRSRKRARIDFDHDSNPAHRSENVVEGSSVLDMDQIKELPQKSNILKSEHIKYDSQQRNKVAVHGSKNVDSRKPSRVASHGSQKVDMHGSPVPEGFAVPQESTVLETFSQQAQLSSDDELTEAAIGQKGTIDVNLNGPASQDGPLSTSRPLEPLSSNIKRLPAGPNEKSRAITGFGKSDPKGPLVQHTAGSQPIDPFTSSKEVPRQLQQSTSTSSFSEKLRKLVHASDTRSTAAHRRPAVQEDPDKTLVETDRPFLPYTRKPSLSSASSSDTSTNTEESTSSQHDLSVWRNALQPHQMNLFDELVTVSHRLVQHLVERETAAANIVADYRTRALQLVENMEATHAKQLQELTQGLTDRKKRLRKELSECGKKLKACTASVRVEKRGSADLQADDGGMEEKLQSLMAEYCYV